VIVFFVKRVENDCCISQIPVLVFSTCTVSIAYL